MKMRNSIFALLAFLMTACAGQAPSRPPASTAESTGAESRSKAGDQVAEIAATPLTDLNIVRAKIPPILLAARKKPYAVPEDTSCPALTSEVQELDAVLGADLDVPATTADPGLVERGAGLVGQAAVRAARGAAEGVVPFRSWVRKLSGAERHSKEVSASIAAGGIRRAFLKGLGQAAGCQPPAAPRKKMAPEE
jgi:hypothetical protein